MLPTSGGCLPPWAPPLAPVRVGLVNASEQTRQTRPHMRHVRFLIDSRAIAGPSSSIQPGVPHFRCPLVAVGQKDEHVGAETRDLLRPTTTRQALRTPRAAAIAGIVFSVLMSATIVLIRLALPNDPRETAIWVSAPVRRIEIAVALNLVPFAGIAFLWFIGVVRDRMGQHEDRFFASVFLGSGLLFVAMLFSAMAVAGGIFAVFQTSGSLPNDLWRLGYGITYALMSTYAMRMAAVFTISTATIALRIAIMPRWLGFTGYLSALVLLLGSGFVAWLELVFPLWVLLVSVEILVTSLRTRDLTLAKIPSERST